MNYMDNHPVTCILNFVTAVLIASHQCCITIELKFIRNQFHRETLFLVILQTLLVWPRLGLLKHGNLSNVECFLYCSYLFALFKFLSESFLGLLLSICCFLLFFLRIKLLFFTLLRYCKNVVRARHAMDAQHFLCYFYRYNISMFWHITCSSDYGRLDFRGLLLIFLLMFIGVLYCDEYNHSLPHFSDIYVAAFW